MIFTGCSLSFQGSTVGEDDSALKTLFSTEGTRFFDGGQTISNEDTSYYTVVTLPNQDGGGGFTR